MSERIGSMSVLIKAGPEISRILWMGWQAGWRSAGQRRCGSAPAWGIAQVLDLRRRQLS